MMGSACGSKGEETNAYKNSVNESGHLKPNRTWENSIKIDAAEVVWGEGSS
jgi:hypothetical protein